MIELTVIVADPLLATVSVWVDDPPTNMVPNARFPLSPIDRVAGLPGVDTAGAGVAGVGVVGAAGELPQPETENASAKSVDQYPVRNAMRSGARAWCWARVRIV